MHSITCIDRLAIRSPKTSHADSRRYYAQVRPLLWTWEYRVPAIDGHGRWIVVARLVGAQQLHASWRAELLPLRCELAIYLKWWWVYRVNCLICLFYLCMQLLNFHFPLLLWMLRVWVTELLVLEWPGAQQYHLSVWFLWRWSSDWRVVVTL